MSTPNAIPGQGRLPARPVVSAEAVARLPRGPLWLLCIAYILPGFIGRDPWKADGLTFGVIWQIAQGHSAWLAPSLYGQHVSGGWLPYWLGAISTQMLGPSIGAIMASRVPFIFLLGLILIQTWYATYWFSLRDMAQPVQPAFAPPIPRRSYARAIADGALLSLVASLGLLGRGHETIPDLVQLAGFTTVLQGLSLYSSKPAVSAIALLTGLLFISASGAPWLGLCAALVTIALASRHAEISKYWAPVAGASGGAVAALLVLVATHGATAAQWPSWKVLEHFAGTIAWFMWPTWPLAGWAVWRWRESLGEWHVLAPLSLLVLAIASALVVAGNASGSLVLALPPAAVLAALALPVLRRGTLAALDWFSLMFFSLLALIVWVLWLAMLTGVPAKPAANIARLAPGFVSHFSWIRAVFAVLATLCWAALVSWRAGRHRHPLWKGMVLSAGGVTLVWLLVALLWLPVLNYASTYRPLGSRIGAVVRSEPRPPEARVCIQTLWLSQAQQALIGYFSGVPIVPGLRGHSCPYTLLTHPPRTHAPVEGESEVEPILPPLRHAQRGVLLWSGQRPGEHNERMYLYMKPNAQHRALP